MQKARIRVVVRHQFTLTRDAIATALGLLADIDVVGTVSSLAEAAIVSRREQADVIVIDLGTDRAATFAAIARLSAACEATRVVCLVDLIDAAGIAEGERVGIDHLVSTTVGLGALVDAIRGDPAVAVRHFVHVNGAAEDRGMQTLTQREYAVLKLVAAGDSRAMIAQALRISAKTVDNHKRNLAMKLGATSQAHAVSIALRRGLLPRVVAPQEQSP